ncbi:14383_t:CDS:1, partial [Acaulospora colombiana]
DDQIDDDSDAEVDYMYSPFGRPPSRLGHRVLSAARKQSSNIRRNKNHISIERLKVDNSFLRNQNVKLSLELEHSRSTIQALKNIVNQKDLVLQNIRNENQNAILKIRILETLVMSKHAKDGSIILRSGGGEKDGGNVMVVNESDDRAKESVVDSVPNKESPSPMKQTRQKQTKQPPQSTLVTPQQPSSKSSTENPPTSQQPQITASSSDHQKPQPSLSLLPKRQKHQRRWSMDFGPRNSLANEDGSSDELEITSVSSNRHTVSPNSSTICVSGRQSTSSSRKVPRLIKRKTGDIIQSLASCRPTSTKNGYDYSPPATPTLVRSDTSDDEDGDQGEEEIECEDIDEKLQKQRKLGQRLFNRIFSSSSSTTAAARGPLSC